MAQEMLALEGVRKSFGDVEVLHGIDLTVHRGEVVAILGPSGSGKTTLLRCANFLERADAGTLALGGERFDLAHATKREVAAVRKKTAFVFQNYNLFRNRTVLGNVTEGLIVARKMPRAQAEEIARGCLERVGMGDRADAYPIQLSGGQQQRVALARTLNQNPKIILADEPVASLDPITAKQVMQDFVRINKEYKISILLNIHHVDLALKYCDRVIGIRAGEIVFDGPASTITQEQIDEVYNGAKAPTMGEGEGELPKAARAEG